MNNHVLIVGGSSALGVMVRNAEIYLSGTNQLLHDEYCVSFECERSNNTLNCFFDCCVIGCLVVHIVLLMLSCVCVCVCSSLRGPSLTTLLIWLRV